MWLLGIDKDKEFILNFRGETSWKSLLEEEDGRILLR
jgi:hypothetical protein